MFYIKQINDGDCGFASLKILLANIYKDKEYLCLPQNETKKSYSFLEIIKIAKEHGVTLVGKKYDKDTTFSEYDNFPCIISLNLEGRKHCAVILKKKKNCLLLLDPDSGYKWVSIKEIDEIWDKYTLEVDGVAQDDKAPKLFKHLIRKRDLIVIHSLQILLNLSLMSSIYFLKNNFNSLIIALVGISLYVIFSMLFRTTINKCLKNMSIKLIDRLNNLPKDKRKFITRLSNYKKTFFVGRIQLINNLITVFFLSSILIYNNSNNAFIILITLFVSVLSATFISKIKRKHFNKIANLERDISSNCKEDFVSAISEIEDCSSKFSQIDLLTSIFEYGLILLGIVFVLTNFDSLSMVSVIFYFMICVQLLKSWNSILSYRKQENELLISKIFLSMFFND